MTPTHAALAAALSALTDAARRYPDDWDLKIAAHEARQALGLPEEPQPVLPPPPRRWGRG